MCLHLKWGIQPICRIVILDDWIILPKLTVQIQYVFFLFKQVLLSFQSQGEAEAENRRLQTILTRIHKDQPQIAAVNKEVVQDQSHNAQHSVKEGQKMAQVMVVAKSDEPRKDKTGSAKRSFLKKFFKR